MNLEAINKWLDEEYGCSYTRLEELHAFYFEKYCDLQQENKQLKENWNKLKKDIAYELLKLREPNEYNNGLFNAFTYINNEIQELEGDNNQ